MKRLGLLIGLVIGLTSCAHRPAKERPLVFGINRVGGEGALYSPPEYGENLYRRLREIGGTAVRLAASPREIERERGRRDWSNFERDLDLALKYGMEPMVCIVNTPIWAMPVEMVPDASAILARPEKERYDRLMAYTHQYPYRTELLPEFTDFCRDLAARTRGRARIFQLWNEPNGCSWHFHDGWNHADEYVPVLKAAREGLKAGNPDCVLLLGGLDDAEGHAPIFMRLTYEETAKQFPDAGRLFDGITDHPYSHDPETMRRKLLALREILESHGDGDLPIWITEYGWHTGGMSLEEQARKVREFLAAFVSPEWDFLTGAIMLALADFEGGPAGFGLCDANLRPRPAFHAFQGAPRFGASPPYKIRCVPIGPDRVEVTWKTMLPASGRLEVEGRPAPIASSVIGTEQKLSSAGFRPGEEFTFTIRTTVAGAGGSGKREYTSAPHTFRMPDVSVSNGDFERGFFGGIAQGWTITGQAFCTDAALIPDLGPFAGNHAQAIHTSGKENHALDSVMFSHALARGGETCRLTAMWRSELRDASVPIMARLGIEPSGGEDPASESIVWSDWRSVPTKWTRAEVAAEIPEPRPESGSRPADADQVITCFIECRALGNMGTSKPIFLVDSVELHHPIR